MATQLPVRVFIGSDSESIEAARELQLALRPWCTAELWEETFDTPSVTTIEMLVQELPQFDFAILLANPTDSRVMRGHKQNVPRDNLIFEAGLSIGTLGRARTFLVCPKGNRPTLPSDLASVSYITYDQEAPYQRSAFGPVATLIGKEILKHGPRLLHQPRNIMANTATPFIKDVLALTERFQHVAFATGVLRTTWSAVLSYDLSKVNVGVIVEVMTLSFSCVNITKETVDYPLKLVSLDDTSTDELVELSREKANGSRISLLERTRTKHVANGLKERHYELQMVPADTYHVSLKYINTHPVCRDTCYVHNSLTTREPALSAHLSVTVPKGFRFNVIAMGALTPDKFRERWTFRLPEPLMPNQMIEYILRKQ